MGARSLYLTKGNEKVKVVVRCRPLNINEIKHGFYNIVTVSPSLGEIKICNSKEDDKNGKTFTFDAVYGSNSTQEEIYAESVEPVVTSVLNGFNGTIFAYGQTGTGKTFTMEGNQLDPIAKGVIQKSFEQIFNHIIKSKSMDFLVRASYIEIYQEEVKDLLDGNEKKCYELGGIESGIFIKNLKSRECKNVREMEEVMQYGNKIRKTGLTNMNEHSSRSHAIFIITVEIHKQLAGIDQIRVGKLNLVDLAGSERQSKSCASGKQLFEASKINLSLSALGNVISALSSGKKFHIPYRDSKITRLLQDSLGGNSKTLLIANIGPANYNYEESLTTLRYANRAKNIKNLPKINEDSKDRLLREYQDEILRLKALIKVKHVKKIQKDQTIEKQFTNNKLFLINEKRCIEELKQKIKKVKCQLHNNKTSYKEKNSILQKQKREILMKDKNISMLKKHLKQEELLAKEINKATENLRIDIERKWRKVEELTQEIKHISKVTSDVNDKFIVERRKLEKIQNTLIKEYKIKQIIIEHFIPLKLRENQNKSTI